MIKKYKFLFILLFGLFVFIPKDTFAMEIVNVEFYDSGYNKLKTVSLDEFTFKTFTVVENVRYIYFNYQSAYTQTDINYTAKILYQIRMYRNSAPTNSISRMAVQVPSKYINGNTSGTWYDSATYNHYLLGTTKIADTSTPIYEAEYEGYINWTNKSKSSTLTITVNLGENMNLIGIGVPENYLRATDLDNGGGTGGDNASSSDIINGTQDIIDNNNKNTNKINGTLKDDDVSGANDEASGFFNDFESDDFGLSNIITMPLQFIQGLSSSTCYSLNLPLPFVDTNVTLPCMTSIYQTYFGDFLTLYQIITTGFIAYGVCINIFRLVQGFKNPDNDNVEVMEL